MGRVCRYIGPMNTIYLDSNVWDLLHTHTIDLLEEFPEPLGGGLVR